MKFLYTFASVIGEDRTCGWQNDTVNETEF